MAAAVYKLLRRQHTPLQLLLLVLQQQGRPGVDYRSAVGRPFFF